MTGKIIEHIVKLNVDVGTYTFVTTYVLIPVSTLPREAMYVFIYSLYNRTPLSNQFEIWKVTLMCYPTFPLPRLDVA